MFEVILDQITFYAKSIKRLLKFDIKGLKVYFCKWVKKKKSVCCTNINNK